MRFPSRPSKRSIRNQLAFMAGEVGMEQSAKRGPQPEGETNKAIAQWAALKPSLLLGRNKRRLATPVGYHQPIMLGWIVDGSPDWIGYQSITITPDLVGKRVAVFVGIEAKRPKGGSLSEAQESFLNALKDAGGISGVARNAEDCEVIVARYQHG